MMLARIISALIVLVLTLFIVDVVSKEMMEYNIELSIMPKETFIGFVRIFMILPVVVHLLGTISEVFINKEPELMYDGVKDEPEDEPEPKKYMTYTQYVKERLMAEKMLSK